MTVEGWVAAADLESSQDGSLRTTRTQPLDTNPPGEFIMVNGDLPMVKLPFAVDCRWQPPSLLSIATLNIARSQTRCAF